MDSEKESEMPEGIQEDLVLNSRLLTSTVI